MGAFLLLAGVLLVASPASASTDARASAKVVEEGLTCQCGCGLTVHSCNHVTCSSAIPLRQEVRTLVDEGLDGDAILVRFREKYGEKILAAPTSEGFNLTAWVLPFVVLGLGFVLVVSTIRRWQGDPDPGPDDGPSISDEDRALLEEELRRSDGRGDDPS